MHVLWFQNTTVKKHVDQEFRIDCLSKPELLGKGLILCQGLKEMIVNLVNALLVSDRRINLNIRDLQELFLPEEKNYLSPSKLCRKCFQEVGPESKTKECANFKFEVKSCVK